MIDTNCRRLIVILTVSFFSLIVRADVIAFSGEGGKKLFIESAASLGRDVHLIRFFGVETPWAEKVIKTVRVKSQSGERYKFTYDLELSSGVEKREYVMVLDAGKTLKDGSLVRQIELYYPGAGGQPLKLAYDSHLSEKSQKMNLAADYKKSPYSPEVD